MMRSRMISRSYFLSLLANSISVMEDGSIQAHGREPVQLSLYLLIHGKVEGVGEDYGEVSSISPSRNVFLPGRYLFSPGAS